MDILAENMAVTSDWTAASSGDLDDTTQAVSTLSFTFFAIRKDRWATQVDVLGSSKDTDKHALLQNKSFSNCLNFPFKQSLVHIQVLKVLAKYAFGIKAKVLLLLLLLL